MDIQLGDILVMKKAHPCGEKQWKVLRTGADFRLKCMGCGHELMTPRHKTEKSIKKRIPEENIILVSASGTLDLASGAVTENEAQPHAELSEIPEEYIEYALPLIQGEMPPMYENGLPSHLVLK